MIALLVDKVDSTSNFDKSNSITFVSFIKKKDETSFNVNLSFPSGWSVTE